MRLWRNIGFYRTPTGQNPRPLRGAHKLHKQLVSHGLLEKVKKCKRKFLLVPQMPC